MTVPLKHQDNDHQGTLKAGSNRAALSLTIAGQAAAQPLNELAPAERVNQESNLRLRRESQQRTGSSLKLELFASSA